MTVSKRHGLSASTGTYDYAELDLRILGAILDVGQSAVDVV